MALKTISFVCGVAACICAVSAAHADTAPSVAEILGFPHASQLTSANGRIAWVVEQGGARSVWTASVPDFEARRVADFAEDDGKRLSELSLSSDGDYLAFARNSDPLRGGAAPNASDFPTGDLEEIWAGSVSSAPRLVANGTDPVLDPHARRLVFSDHGALYSIDLANRNATPEAILVLRGAVHSPSFSPDGKKLAFIRDLGALSYVGVYDFTTRVIKWMAPDFSRDMLPAWSPNGRSIAFIRRAGREFDDDSDVMLTPWAFSVAIADVDPGEGHIVWRSPVAAGGFAQAQGLPLAWSGDDAVVFQSEHDGWLRAYSLDVKGAGAPQALTPPDCEIEHASFDAATGVLLTSNNCSDIDRRHIWISDVKTGEAHALTSGPVIDLSPVATGPSQIAFLGSDYVSPLAVSVIERNGEARRRLPPFDKAPAKFASVFQEPKEVTFRSRGGYEIHAQLFEPQGRKAGEKLPALIFAHGGPHRQMFPGWHELHYYSNAYALNQLAASRGFIALSVNYRSGTGFGAAFRNAPYQGPKGNLENEDFLAAAKYLAEKAGADPARIGIWGGSQGGVITAYALAHNSNVFAAGVDIHGVHDWRRFAFDQYNLDAEVFPQTYEDMLASASAVQAIDRWRSPVLLISGDDDEAVDVKQTVDLAVRLEARNVDVETLLIPNEGHDWRRQESWVRVGEAMFDFFERRLTNE